MGPPVGDKSWRCSRLLPFLQNTRILNEYTQCTTTTTQPPLTTELPTARSQAVVRPSLSPSLSSANATSPVLGHHGNQGHTGRDTVLGAGAVRSLAQHQSRNADARGRFAGPHRGEPPPEARWSARRSRSPHWRTRCGHAGDHDDDDLDDGSEGVRWRQDLWKGCGFVSLVLRGFADAERRS
jgi:hypothetical protein